MLEKDIDHYVPQGTALLLVRLGIVLLALVFLFLLTTLLWYSNFVVVHLIFLAALVAIFRPLWCLYFLALVFPLFGNNPGGKHVLYFVDLILMVVVVRWMLPLAFRREIRLRKTPFDIAVFFFVFISALSIIPLHYYIWDEYLFFGQFFPFVKEIYTTYATTLRWSLRAFLDLLLGVVLFYYLVNNLRELREVRNLLRCFLIAMFAALLIGILDYHGLISLTFFRPPNKDILRFGYERLQSFFWHSGWFAEYVTMLAPFYIAALIFAGKKRRWFAVVGLALIAYGLLFTYARGGWLTFLLTIAFFLALAWERLARLFYKRQFWIAALGIVIVGGALTVCGMVYLRHIRHPLYQRVFNVFNSADRIYIWDAALQMYGKYPLFGIGLGDHYIRHLCDFPEPHRFWYNDKVMAHNVYLQILVERGPFALLAFVIIIGIGFRWGLEAFRRCQPSDARRKFIAGALGGLFAFAVYGIFQDMFYVRVIEILFWMLLGLLFFLFKFDLSAARMTRGKWERAAIIAAIILLLAARAHNLQFKDLYFRNLLYGQWWLCGKKITYVQTDVSKPVVKTFVWMAHPQLQSRPVTLHIYANGVPVSSNTYSDKKPHEEILYLPDFLGRRVELRFEVDRTWRLRDWGLENFLYNFGAEIRLPLQSGEFEQSEWGFYPAQKSGAQLQRWTRQRAALRLEVAGKTLVVPLLARNPNLLQRPLAVRLYINSELARTVRLKEKDKWYEVRLDVSLKQGESFVLGFFPARTWQPSQFGYDDTRDLGVLVGTPRWE